MAKAITIRLDDADHAALQRQSERLKIRPGTLARMLVHAGLRDGPASGERSEALAALDRMVQRSRMLAPSDAVRMVEARPDSREDRHG